ncbi:MAG: carbohydrate ABC transporter permease [Bacilli bacterium]|nr:carbohydrate ABC transporter permease [Bacilli bacterium]
MENTENRLILLDREIARTPKQNPLKSYNKEWKKKSVTERAVLIVMLIIFIIYGFSLIFPLIWTFYNSFKDSFEFNSDMFSLPKTWTPQNYIDAFKELGSSSLGTAIWNSVWMSVLSTVLGLFASSLTAYVVAKYRFKGSKVIYTISVFIQIIPLVGAVTGMYELIHGTLQIANEPLLIWPIWFGGFGFSFLMLYGAFKNVPWSFAESAFIDGAGHFRTFFQIMLPTIRPVLASLFVVNFIGAWNDYMTPYLYMDQYPTLSLLVYNSSSDGAALNYPKYFAVIVISVIPTLILFVAFQKLIMENTTTGGLKG